LFDGILHLMNTNAGSCDVVLETTIESDIIVRMKVSSTLRVARTEKFEVAARKLGCDFKVERMSTTNGR